MGLLRTIDATVEPVSTAEAKANMRYTLSVEDAVIDGKIKTAREMAEAELHRSLLPQTWELTMDKFPESIQLYYPPIIGVSTLKYREATAGVWTTLNPSSYTVDIKSEPGWIVPAYGYDWPDIYDTINAVEVTYTAGYATPAAVPAKIKEWILLYVGHLFENREATIPGVSITPLPFLDRLLSDTVYTF